jgi:hypothetical protein
LHISNGLTIVATVFCGQALVTRWSADFADRYGSNGFAEFMQQQPVMSVIS